MNIDLKKTPLTQDAIDNIKNTRSLEYYLMFCGWVFAAILTFQDSYRNELVEFMLSNIPVTDRFIPSIGLLLVGIIFLGLSTARVHDEVMYKRLLTPAPQKYYKKIKQALQMKEVRDYVDAVIAQGRGLTYLEIHHIQDYRANYKEQLDPIAD